MLIELHPQTPQARLMKKVIDAFASGQVIVYPTDSGYSMGCDISSSKGVQKLYHLKRAMKKYVMALMVRDFSALSDYAKIDTAPFRYMKALVPGPYTFILPSTIRARKVLNVNRPEVGVRMPSSPFTDSLFELAPGAVILTTAAKIKEEDHFIHPADIEEMYGNVVDMVLDVGALPVNPTTIISLMTDAPEVIREGAGRIPGAGGHGRNSGSKQKKF